MFVAYLFLCVLNIFDWKFDCFVFLQPQLLLKKYEQVITVSKLVFIDKTA